ncbi:hypothetical protein ABHI18_005522 [Aspergillus niger]
MERIGKTVVLVGREIPPPVWFANQHKYEADFAKKFTTWEDEAAKFKAHQRIIQYNFVNIHMVVRSASDTSIQNQELDSEYGNASTNTTRLTSTVLLKALAGCRYIKAASQLLRT